MLDFSKQIVHKIKILTGLSEGVTIVRVSDGINALSPPAEKAKLYFTVLREICFMF
jgi:hypothetical protein